MILQSVSGDRAAQYKLYTLLLPYLNLICKRYLTIQSSVPDVLQDSFVSIFKHLDSYDPSKASLKTWCTTITINCCIKYNKRHQAKGTLALYEDYTELATEPEVLSKLSNDDLLHFLNQMPETFRTVFNLYLIDGYTHDEIAILLDIQPALSRQRLLRARTWLKQNESDLIDPKPKTLYK
jgi:RNA polymerase sigma factor (sigma-70 family)